MPVIGDFDREFTSTVGVAAALEALEEFCIPRRDRRGVFVTAYLRITRALMAEIEAGGFQDPEWVTRYLICFGNLYRRAHVAWERGELDRVPKSWRLSFEAARDGVGLVIQHLILGVNAHINHDLALALVEVGLEPRPLRYADHTRVNDVLERATEDLKHHVAVTYAPVLQRLDRIAGRRDDDFTRFSIPKAREHAWTYALALDNARTPAERLLLERSLDDQAAVLARLILSSPTRHPVLLRAVRVAEKVDGLFRGAGR
jgi:hypothetical protein